MQICKMDHEARGIGFIDGKITFVPYTITGDEVEIKIIKDNKNYNVANVTKRIKNSDDYVSSFCPYYGKCGGCNLQNFSYEKTLNYKLGRIKNILNRVNYNGKINIIKNDSPLYYRNKIELKMIDSVLGYYEYKTNNIVPINECKIAKKALNNFISELYNMHIKNGDITLRCNYNDEILISIKTNDEVYLNEVIYPKYKVVGIILNDNCIYGEDHFLDKIGSFFFEVSYNSFFQVNSYINNEIFNIIKENVTGNNVLDLYSGVGTLSIMASTSAKEVFAIETIPNAVLNAVKNAKINNIQNVHFILGNVEDKIDMIKDKINTVIVDPPRRGLDKYTISKLLEIRPNKIIYISCENQKLTEDIKNLLDTYTINDVYALDMFSYSHNTETILILNKNI